MFLYSNEEWANKIKAWDRLSDKGIVQSPLLKEFGIGSVGYRGDKDSADRMKLEMSSEQVMQSFVAAQRVDWSPVQTTQVKTALEEHVASSK